MKHIVIVIAALFLVACDEAPKNRSNTSGWEIACIEGYEYVYRSEWGSHKGFLAPKFGQDRMPVKCESK